MHLNLPTSRARNEHQARWSTEGSAAASGSGIEHPRTMLLIDTQLVGMPVNDGACIRVALPQLGVALGHEVHLMTVLYCKPPACKIECGAVGQGCKLAPFLFPPLRGHIVVANDRNDGPLRPLRLLEHARTTDITGTHRQLQSCARSRIRSSIWPCVSKSKQTLTEVT